jgi:hypothetical protein
MYEEWEDLYLKNKVQIILKLKRKPKINEVKTCRNTW